MNNLSNMIWVEGKKSLASKIPVWTSGFALILPIMIGLMILISKNPEISRKLGVISAKADLIGFSATNWSAFMGLVATDTGDRRIFHVYPHCELDIRPRIC